MKSAILALVATLSFTGISYAAQSGKMDRLTDSDKSPRQQLEKKNLAAKNICKVTCKFTQTYKDQKAGGYVTEILDSKSNLVVQDDENIYFEPVVVNGTEYRFSLWTDDEMGGFTVEKKIQDVFRKVVISTLDQRELLDNDILDTSKCDRNENALFIEQRIQFFPENPTFIKLKLTCNLSE